MQSLKKEIKGITLVALVVTIIVLLILAGVALNLTIGKNKIFENAKEAIEKTKEASAKEKVEMEIAASQSENGNIDIILLNENLAKIKGLTHNQKQIVDNPISNLPAEVELDGYTIEINEKYEKIVSAKDILKASNKSEYYGAIVNGYECENNAGVSDWKILYADDTNIYLIASDYISYEYCPPSKSNSITRNSDYQLSMNNVISDYKGSSDITDERMQKLNSDYFEKEYSSSNENMKAVAYMLDTEVWKPFKGDYAEYAIGGPTIELLMKSINQKYNVDYKARAARAVGYEISTDGGNSWNWYVIQEIKDSLYYINDTTKSTSMWTASPSGYREDCLNTFDNNGTIGRVNCRHPNIGFRPVVCLKSDVKLKEIENNLFEIM